MEGKQSQVFMGIRFFISERLGGTQEKQGGMEKNVREVGQEPLFKRVSGNFNRDPRGGKKKSGKKKREAQETPVS